MEFLRTEPGRRSREVIERVGGGETEQEGNESSSESIFFISKMSSFTLTTCSGLILLPTYIFHNLLFMPKEKKCAIFDD